MSTPKFRCPPVLLSSDANALEAALRAYGTTATVEAEYGDRVVRGTICTLAHHGPRSTEPCPCLCENYAIGLDAIGISHLDLDTIGGVLGLLGYRPLPASFWEVVAKVDVLGPHKIGHGITGFDADLTALAAYHAWSLDHRVYPDRDGGVRDVARDVEAAYAALVAISWGDPGMLEAGRARRDSERDLDELSFVAMLEGGVIVRMADEFTSHLYSTPGGKLGRAVVAYRSDPGVITLSLADPVCGVDCAAIAQRLWGPDAGGRATIAGSPRGKKMSYGDVVDAAFALSALLRVGGAS